MLLISWRTTKTSETLSGVFKFEKLYMRIYMYMNVRT